MSKKVLEKFKEEWLFYLIILVSVIFFFTPFYREGFPKGDETDFHYVRIMTLADSLRAGVFPAKIHISHLRTYGYGIGFFYPDLLIYPPAILIARGAEYGVTIKAYLFVLTLIGSFLTYSCFKKLSGRKEIALIGEILFLNSHLMDNNIFEGGGMPHLMAYLFLPLLFCSLLWAFEDRKWGYIGYAFALMMVLLTHNMIFITMMFALVIMVLINGGRIVKKPLILGKLIVVSLVAMTITTAYWLPAMEQMMHVQFIAFFDNAYDVTDHILTFKRMIDSHLSPQLFVVFVLSVIADVAVLVRKKKLSMDTVCIFFTNIILMWLMCSKAVWGSSIGKSLNFFEYTSRFEYVVVNLMVVFAVLSLRELFESFEPGGFLQSKKAECGVVVFCVILLFATRFSVRPDFLNPGADERMELSRRLIEEEYIVSGAEWLPVECEPSACNEPQTAKADDGSGADGFKHDDGKYFEVWVDLEKEYYDMPYVYYYGYRAYVLDENENPIQELSVGEAFDDNGYVRVYMPDNRGGIGHVMVTYRKTFAQKIAYIITMVSLVALAVAVIVGGIVGRKKRT